MKNLCIRFVMAVLVTGFTYAVFLSGTLDVSSTHQLRSPLSFENLIVQSKQDSTHFANDSTTFTNEEQVRKLNYAAFRRSLMRHRSIYYANQD